MPKTNRPISRKTENTAINPGSEFHVEKTFIAPYGWPISERVLEEYTTDSDGDMGAIDHAGIRKTLKSARIAAIDYIHAHERRVNGDGWDVNEAHTYQEQLNQLEAQKAYNRQLAENELKYGYLNKLWQDNTNKLSESTDIQACEDFETMSFDDPEIIPPSTSNQLSPIFSSTGRVIKTSHRSSVNEESMVVDEYKQFIGYLGSPLTMSHVDSDFTPVNIVIPSHVPRQYWLDYCLKRINPPGMDVYKDIPKISMCLTV